MSSPMMLTVLLAVSNRVSGFRGMECWTGEWWNGMVDWNGGMEWWTGMVEWNGLIGISSRSQLFAVTMQQFVYTSVGR